MREGNYHNFEIVQAIIDELHKVHQNCQENTRRLPLQNKNAFWYVGL